MLVAKMLKLFAELLSTLKFILHNYFDDL